MAEPGRGLILDDVISALAGRGCKPKRAGKGWKARCPAHEDDNPSLSIGVGTRRRVLIKCHAGCSYEDIVRALGLWSDEPPKKTASRGKGGGLGDIVAIYSYGSYEVIRFAPKTFRQRRPDGAGGFIWNLRGVRPRLYREADLEGKEAAIIVEGEKDADRLHKLGWPSTCNSGGAGKWRKTHTKILGKLGVLSVKIIADNDAPGRKHARAVAAACLNAGITAAIVDLPDGVRDASDFLDQPGELHELATDLAKLCRSARPWSVDGKIPEISRREQEHVTSGPEALVANRHYRILGLAGDGVAIRISAGRVLQRSRESLCSATTLVSLAPVSYWTQLSGTEGLSVVSARALGDALLRAADRLGAVDLASIYGRGAARRRDGTICYHLGDRLLAGGEVHGLDDDGSGAVWLAEPRVDLGDRASRDAIETAAGAVLRYRWRTPEDGRRVLGWLAVAVAGGALEWRPHLMMAAPAGTGKSWFLRNVIGRILGDLLLKIADGTVASVARLTSASALPITIDEAEPTGRWIQDLLGLLRIASGGDGLRVRADGSSTGVTVQAPRFSALLSATAVPRMGAADASRVSVVRLGGPVGDWPDVRSRITAAMEHGPGIRSALIRDAEAIAEAATEITRQLEDFGEMTSREALTAGALTAGWRWWAGRDAEMVVGASVRDEADDAADALLELLALRVRYDGGDGTSALAALRRPSRQDHVADTLGMRPDGVGGLMIAPLHRGLLGALRRSRLAATDLRQLLIQIPGVEVSKNPRRFGGLRQRAVLVPEEVLERFGVDLTIDV